MENFPKINNRGGTTIIRYTRVIIWLTPPLPPLSTNISTFISQVISGKKSVICLSFDFIKNIGNWWCILNKNNFSSNRLVANWLLSLFCSFVWSKNENKFFRNDVKAGLKTVLCFWKTVYCFFPLNTEYMIKHQL